MLSFLSFEFCRFGAGIRGMRGMGKIVHGGLLDAKFNIYYFHYVERVFSLVIMYTCCLLTAVYIGLIRMNMDYKEFYVKVFSSLI